jgi:hypothetical protein
MHDVTDIASMVGDLAIIGASNLPEGDRPATWTAEMAKSSGKTPHLTDIRRQAYEMYSANVQITRPARI